MEQQTVQIVSNSNGTNGELVNIQLSQDTGNLLVQFDVFDQQRQSEQPPSLQSFNGINIYSHPDITQAILRQITPAQEAVFLNVLQHLLSIDGKHKMANAIWNTIEKLVYRATLIEKFEDSERLLRATLMPTTNCPRCSWSDDSSMPSMSPLSTPTTPSSSRATQSSATTIPPIAKPPDPQPLPPPSMPPPPPPPPIPSMPPPPPMPGLPPPPPMPGMPPPPPPPGMAPPPPPGAPRPPGCPVPPHGGANMLTLPHQQIPVPTTKMKTLNWVIIPMQKIAGKLNMWTQMADNRKQLAMANLDFKELEQLFCLSVAKPKALASAGDVVDGKANGKCSTVHLINGKRSLNINIFLKQFKGLAGNDGVAELIRSGNHKLIGPERLRGLLKLLPDAEEIETLQSYEGDRQRLGSAEQFLLQMLAIPNYKLCVETMLLKEEFAASITSLEPNINAIIEAGNNLISNQSVMDIIYIVMMAGNFLNSGGYAGNAAGIRLSALTTLTDIRANKPGMNLMHFVSTQIAKFYPQLLEFPNDMRFLENVAKINLDEISSDIKAMDKQLQKIGIQIQMPNIEQSFKDDAAEFLQMADNKLTELKLAMEQVEAIRLKLAEFFCEDAPKFRLDECFKIFHTFAEKFTQSLRENEKREHAERQSLERQRQKEEQQRTLKSKTDHSRALAQPHSKRMRTQNCQTSGGNERRISILVASNSGNTTPKLQGNDLMQCLNSPAEESPRGKKTRITIAYKNQSDAGAERERFGAAISITNGQISSADATTPSKAHNMDQPLPLQPHHRLRQMLDRSHSLQFATDLATLPEEKCLPPALKGNDVDAGASAPKELPKNINLPPIPAAPKTARPRPPLLRSRTVLEIDPNNPQYYKRDTLTFKTSQVSHTKQLDISEIPNSPASPAVLRPRLPLKNLLRRQCSSINEGDLKEALRSLKTPTIVPDYIWDAHQERVNSIHERFFDFDASTPSPKEETHSRDDAASVARSDAKAGISSKSDQGYESLTDCAWKLPDRFAKTAETDALGLETAKHLEANKALERNSPIYEANKPMSTTVHACTTESPESGFSEKSDEDSFQISKDSSVEGYADCETNESNNKQIPMENNCKSSLDGKNKSQHTILEAKEKDIQQKILDSQKQNDFEDLKNDPKNTSVVPSECSKNKRQISRLGSVAEELEQLLVDCELALSQPLKEDMKKSCNMNTRLDRVLEAITNQSTQNAMESVTETPPEINHNVDEQTQNFDKTPSEIIKQTGHNVNRTSYLEKGEKENNRNNSSNFRLGSVSDEMERLLADCDLALSRSKRKGTNKNTCNSSMEENPSEQPQHLIHHTDTEEILDASNQNINESIRKNPLVSEQTTAVQETFLPDTVAVPVAGNKNTQNIKLNSHLSSVSDELESLLMDQHQKNDADNTIRTELPCTERITDGLQKPSGQQINCKDISQEKRTQNAEESMEGVSQENAQYACQQASNDRQTFTPKDKQIEDSRSDSLKNANAFSRLGSVSDEIERLLADCDLALSRPNGKDNNKVSHNSNMERVAEELQAPLDNCKDSEDNSYGRTHNTNQSIRKIAIENATPNTTAKIPHHETTDFYSLQSKGSNDMGHSNLTNSVYDVPSQNANMPIYESIPEVRKQIANSLNTSINEQTKLFRPPVISSNNPHTESSPDRLPVELEKLVAECDFHISQQELNANTANSAVTSTKMQNYNAHKPIHFASHQAEAPDTHRADKYSKAKALDDAQDPLTLTVLNDDVFETLSSASAVDAIACREAIKPVKGSWQDTLQRHQRAAGAGESKIKTDEPCREEMQSPAPKTSTLKKISQRLAVTFRFGKDKNAAKQISKTDKVLKAKKTSNSPPPATAKGLKKDKSESTQPSTMSNGKISSNSMANTESGTKNKLHLNTRHFGRASYGSDISSPDISVNSGTLNAMFVRRRFFPSKEENMSKHHTRTMALNKTNVKRGGYL